MSTISSPASILITGATGGLGRALALAYAAPATTLILHGRDAAKLTALQNECEQRGARVIPLVLDLRDCEKWIAALGALCVTTPIDLAIVNAGVTNVVGTSEDGGVESWPDIERVLDTNIHAALATISALLPSMRSRRQGQIALISSLAAYAGMPVTPAYCASKAALKIYGEAMRGTLAREGIAINVVLPGFVETAMSEKFTAPKPFLLSADNAAQRIKIGLAKNRAHIGFPLPLALGMWLLAALPPAWSQAVLRALGFAGARRAR